MQKFNIKKVYMVPKKSLLTIAGLVWFMAGFNVLRLGLISYGKISINFLWPLLSICTFVAFGFMFLAMAKKHTKRILNSKDDFKPFWTFFDLKSYLIMIFMMSSGIGLRASNLLSHNFIGFFYSGLGSALSLSGLYFLKSRIKNK